MRYWLTLIVTAAVLFSLTFLLGLSVIGVDLFGPEEAAHQPEKTHQTATEGHAADNNKEPEEKAEQHEDNQTKKTEVAKESLEAKTGKTEGGKELTEKKPSSSQETEEKQEVREEIAQEQSPEIKKYILEFQLNAGGVITAEIVDRTGKLVRKLLDGEFKPAGKHSLTWQGMNEQGETVAPGQYTFRVTATYPGVPVLLYHHLAKPEEVEAGNPYVLSTTQFARQINYLKDNGYTTISLTQLGEYLTRGTQLPDKPVVITFDDGYASTYHQAFPILKQYGLKAIIFILGSFVDNSNASPPSLTWKQMQEMVRSGVVEIQSHSYDLHGEDDLVQKTEESQSEYEQRIYKDLVKIKQLIETKTGQPVTALSWPNGKQNSRALAIAKKAGYSYFFTSGEEVNYQQDSPTRIRRIFIPQNIKLSEFAQKIKAPPKKVTVHQETFQFTPKN
ncbi:polysaccharide deacetylase family protein [Calderihabitans maritimus]|uniref:Xylanase/chitin deacetylase n=1 Tax=Calderihabitans maritimus TaxID=1246530 RepID=A0A1Z5HWN3_9FIRM|nr:polysaccharide deacetylase family protein [Calderihabitans maritimus]GAW93767.1 xylanase/chitin deacetylase [Calderihabitans maritimus]